MVYSKAVKKSKEMNLGENTYQRKYVGDRKRRIVINETPKLQIAPGLPDRLFVPASSVKRSTCEDYTQEEVENVVFDLATTGIPDDNEKREQLKRSTCEDYTQEEVENVVFEFDRGDFDSARV